MVPCVKLAEYYSYHMISTQMWPSPLRAWSGVNEGNPVWIWQIKYCVTWQVLKCGLLHWESGVEWTGEWMKAALYETGRLLYHMISTQMWPCPLRDGVDVEGNVLSVKLPDYRVTWKVLKCGHIHWRSVRVDRWKLINPVWNHQTSVSHVRRLTQMWPSLLREWNVRWKLIYQLRSH